LTTGSALCRLPRRVTSMPPSRAGRDVGHVDVEQHRLAERPALRRSTIFRATPMALSKCSPALLASDTATEGMPSR
jgi:hypothetical protein